MARYKHVYFNLTSSTFVIWVWTVLYAFALYESICYILRLHLRGCLRLSMFVLFAAALYPHYYAWWMYFNYTNDAYYKQWNHQTFFSATEILSTLVVLYLCDRNRNTQLPRYLLIIISIGVLHIMAASGDQFIKNVIMGKGHLYQVFRDIGFMFPDLLNVVIPLCVSYQWCWENGVVFSQAFLKGDLIAACFSIMVLLILCSQL